MSPKFPVNGTPTEQAANLRAWGCGGCSRAADAIERYGAQVTQVEQRLAEAEQLLQSAVAEARGSDTLQAAILKFLRPDA